MFKCNKNISFYLLVVLLLVLSAGTPVKAGSTPDLDKMIGQMIMVGFRGMTVDQSSPVFKDIKEGHIGGVVLFNKDCLKNFGPRNIKNSPQVRSLIADLQKLTSIPLLVAVDQEGGRVERLTSDQGFEETMSAAEIGKSGSSRIAYDEGAKVGEQLWELGFNLDFAPVLDVNVNAENPVIGKLGRSFSADPDVVSRLAEAFIRGLRSQGVLSCVKHFPGHGSSTGDSHLGLTDVTSTWTEKELRPFQYMVENHRTDMVMTAHIFNKNFDPDYPATLSKEVIGELLRKKLGYNGVVITDDMQMKAISSSYGFEDSIYLAINSGADILLFANNIAYQKNVGLKVFKVIKKFVEEGRISRDRIKESYERILKLKKDIIPL